MMMVSQGDSPTIRSVYHTRVNTSVQPTHKEDLTIMFEISKNSNRTYTAKATQWLPYRAFESAHELASARTEIVGTVGFGKDKRFFATFSKKKDAEAFVSAFDSAYEQACAERASKPADKPAPAPKKPRSTKKGNGKAVDFSKVKGADKHARNRAAHALIIGAGIESGSAEYNDLWKEWQSVR